MRLFTVTLMCAGVLFACGRHDDHDHSQLKSGADLYNHHCAACHQGSGDGTFLKGVPPVRYTTMTYRQMVHYIQGHGRAGDSRMPTFSAMPKHEAEAIAIYVRRQLNLR
jgi:mono/diheme cytochrome c family protein